jgi:hypothetical protein
LVSALQFSQTRDAEIAWVDGQLVKEHLKSLTQGEKKMDVDTFDSVPVLEQLPLTEVRSTTFDQGYNVKYFVNSL